jgi:pimeloyl-ACP methyl ester carboxylesterase
LEPPTEKYRPTARTIYLLVVAKVFDMDRPDPDLKASDLGGVSSRTLVVASDDDIITLEHTLELYRGIPDCELAVVPGTFHFLTQEKPQLCNTLIVDFLSAYPVPTVAPMRRQPTWPPA